MNIANSTIVKMSIANVMRLSATAALLLSMVTCSATKSYMRNHPYVNSRPNEIAHDSKNIQRGMIMNMFESDQEKTLNRRPASGTVKDGTNEQDKHIDLSVTTPETDSIMIAGTKTIIKGTLFNEEVLHEMVVKEKPKPPQQAETKNTNSKPNETTGSKSKKKSTSKASTASSKSAKSQSFKAPTASGKILMTINAVFRISNVTVEPDQNKRRQLTVPEQDISAIMEKTIQYMVKSSLTANQSLIAVNITYINEVVPDEILSGTAIGSQLTLTENCDRCENQRETTIMNSTVISFLNQSIYNGNFTKFFQMNAYAQCANKCPDVQYGSVVGGTFNETDSCEPIKCPYHYCSDCNADFLKTHIKANNVKTHLKSVVAADHVEANHKSVV
ncbi:LOW QUALITY PROTEIN: hypothetical protein ACHAXA_001057 [Cyclostephanos tholiformis]|uniref:C2H2-type domain-containing protein n=1 Tax=Cyclostephanos tholiformis TaxID=382380 RepID=A0ABD3RCS2_9STRA